METAASYTPPEILNDMDEETIRARMLENLPSDIDKTEGGFASDFLYPAAIEKADAMIALNEIVEIFFPEWAYGEYLDMHARAVGLTRKPATYASGTVKITGTPGTVIPEGFVLCVPATAIASNVEFALTQEAAIPDDGVYAVETEVQCLASGTVGNVPANSITIMASPISGIDSITNEAAITGGAVEETDDELRQRIMDYDRSSTSSFVGNDADYRRWATEVDGVGSAIVVPEWQGAGTGTVKLVIMDSNGQPASGKLIDDVYNHIMSPDDRNSRLAPIGAILTVTTASELGISITADVALEDDASIESVTAAFKSDLSEYFAEAKEEGCVYLTRIGRILSATSGVKDYSALLLNGEGANITVGADDYPKLSGITLTKAV